MAFGRPRAPCRRRDRPIRRPGPEAREALETAGIATTSLSGRSHIPAVRTGTMHAMKGLEFQAVAVVGVEQGLVPEPGAVTPETEDPLAYAQDLHRERCVLFVACTRARDHLHVSGTGEPSPFLPPGAVEPVPPPPPLARSPGSVGCFAQRPVQDARVAEPVPQGVLQPGDRDEVLRGAGVLVCDGRVAAQHRLRQVRQRG